MKISHILMLAALLNLDPSFIASWAEQSIDESSARCSDFWIIREIRYCNDEREQMVTVAPFLGTI